jgi:hypothetical protein
MPVSKQLSPSDRDYLEKFAPFLSETTTTFGKWVNDPIEEENEPGQSLVTRNPDVIKQWAKKRQATPAISTQAGTYPQLRFIFKDAQSAELKPANWDEWLKTFKEANLTFIYIDTYPNGQTNNFFQLDGPKLNQH